MSLTDELKERLNRLEDRVDLIKRMVSRLSEGRTPPIWDCEKLENLGPLHNENIFPKVVIVQKEE